mgnify:CR=1 FL=1
MKVIEYKQFGNIDEERKLNKKKLVITGVVLIIILIIALLSIIYISSSNFRNFMDKYVLMKNISEDNAAYISLESEENVYTYAYHDYVAVLKNNELNLYNSSGKNVQTLKVAISSPVFETKGKYLVIAEKDQQKVYLIKDKKIVWENDVDGNISDVVVNENGYVAIIVSGTSYKSVIITIDNNGNEIFKTFLSSTLVTEVTMSNDNKYLSFCELDISGTLVESRVKTISIDDAKQKPENSIIYTYQIPSNMLVANLEYHQKNELICMTESQILSLKNGEIEVVDDINKSNITFAGIQLSKSYFKMVENMNGINNQTSNLEIHNTNNKSSCVYTINGVAKSVYSKDGVIAVNVGTEVYFINEKGWLIKKFTSNQEVKDIVIADNIAGIISRNKIQFVGL